MVADTLVARVVGQAARRGRIPRVPTGERMLADIEAWLTAGYPDVVRSMHRSSAGSGESHLRVSFHPGAPACLLTATDAGTVRAEAETVTAGPGYHRYVGRVLERLGLELAISWDRSGAAGADGSAGTAPITFGDRVAVERAYLGWLGRALVGVRTARLAGREGIQIGTPTGVRFTFDGAMATALGPRDDAWLDAALADTRVAIDITPWWADATDAQYLLNRALCLMWFEVRWRPPAIREEVVLLDEVHRLLSKAYPLDPALPYPWRAWAEMVGLRGLADPMARQVVARAGREPEAGPQIGYRRAPVTISHEGWALRIPGAFAERRTDEEWWGGGAGRSITLAAVQTGDAAGAMSAQSFIRQVAGEMGPDAIDHRAGGVTGRATLSTDASSGVEVGVLEGYSAVIGSGAAIRITFDDAADWQWAIDTWRSLAPG